MGYDNVSNLLDLWRETNTVTDSLYSYMFLIATFVIVVMVMRERDQKQVFTAGTLVVSIVAFLMLLAGLVPMGALTICLVLFGASLVWLLFGGD